MTKSMKFDGKDYPGSGPKRARRLHVVDNIGPLRNNPANDRQDERQALRHPTDRALHSDNKTLTITTTIPGPNQTQHVMDVPTANK